MANLTKSDEFCSREFFFPRGPLRENLPHFGAVLDRILSATGFPRSILLDVKPSTSGCHLVTFAVPLAEIAEEVLDALDDAIEETINKLRSSPISDV